MLSESSSSTSLKLQCRRAATFPTHRVNGTLHESGAGRGRVACRNLSHLMLHASAHALLRQACVSCKLAVRCVASKELSA
jgi:hypothetical protein